MLSYWNKQLKLRTLFMTTVGERIKELREKKGLSHEKLAKKLKVDAQTLIAWENGEAQPDNKAARDLAIFLSSTAEYIQFGRDTYMQLKTMFPNKTEPEKVALSSILFMIAAMLAFVGAAGIILLLVVNASSMDAQGLSGYWAYFEDRGFIPSVIAFLAFIFAGALVAVAGLLRRKKDKKGKKNNHGYYF